MAKHRLNQAVLNVRDVAASVAFYHDVLGFEVSMEMDGSDSPVKAAFLTAADSTNDHDLALFAIGAGAAPSAAVRATVGLYHLEWEVDTLGDLAALHDRLAEAGALVGMTDHSTTKSLYGHDPDGLEFEIVWLVPADLIDDTALAHRNELRPLDLAGEIARYGAGTPSGVGVSRASAG
jgi:catechol-2,3-dioxygenase